MKKLILAVSAVAVVASCGLGACSCKKSKSSGYNDYDNLNDMLAESYSQIVLTVNTSYDEDTSLTSEYVMKYSENEITVEYTVERFSSLSLDGSDGFKTVLEGTATIKDGEVTGGEEVGISASIANPKFNFKESYFENVTLTGLHLKADVKNPSAFFGLSLSCTDMKVEATYLIFFSNITISYTQNGNKVEYNYEFTR